MDTQKVAAREKVGSKNSDNAEMRRMGHLGKDLLSFMVKPPTSLVVANRYLHGTEDPTTAGFNLTYLIVAKSDGLETEPFVHYVVCWPNPLKVKLNSERAWDIEISHSYQLVALEIDWLKEKARNIIIFL